MYLRKIKDYWVLIQQTKKKGYRTVKYLGRLCTTEIEKIRMAIKTINNKGKS